MTRHPPLLLLLRLPPPGPTGPTIPLEPDLACGLLATALEAVEAPVRPEVVPPEVAQRAGDRALADWIVRRRPLLLGISLAAWNVRRSLRVARLVREGLPEVRILAGGPEIVPGEEAPPELAGLDLLVAGEGESALPGALAGLLGWAPPAIPEDLWMRLEPYRRDWLAPGSRGEAVLETARGCDLRCGYCFYHRLRRGIAARPIEGVVRQLRFLQEQGARRVYLADPSFLARKDAMELCRSIRAATGGELALHTELRAERVGPKVAREMARAGFRSVECGLQTVNPGAQEILGRRIDPEQYLRGARLLEGEGIRVTTGIILGLPGDDPLGFAATVRFVREGDLTRGLQVYPLLALPGTRFRREADGLGLQFDPIPPYRVLGSPGFNPEELAAAEELCQEELGLDLEAEPLPVVWRAPDRATGRAILLEPDRPLTGEAREAWLGRVQRHVTVQVQWTGAGGDPWGEAVELLGELGRQEPHGTVDLIVEGPDLPDSRRLGELLSARRSARDHFRRDQEGGDRSLRVAVVAPAIRLRRCEPPPDWTRDVWVAAGVDPARPEEMEAALGLPWVDGLLAGPPPESGWDQAARARLRDASRRGLALLIRRR